MFVLLIIPERGGLSVRLSKKGVRENTNGYFLSKTDHKCYSPTDLLLSKLLFSYSQNF